MGWVIFTVLCVVLVAITVRNVQEGFKGQRGTGGGVRYGGASGGVRNGVHELRHGRDHHGGGHRSRGWTTVGSGGGSSWGWWWPFEWWPWYDETIIIVS
jgi:hypothetical protein